MRVTFMSNATTRSSVFVAHLLALMRRVDTCRHAVNFVTLRERSPSPPVPPTSLRTKDRIARFSFPVKVADYLADGNKVIGRRGRGRQSAWR